MSVSEFPAQEVHGLAHGFRGAAKDRVKFNRTEHHEAAENAKRKTKVTHAVDHEGLDGGGIGRVLLEPEADEQIGRKAHTFPAEEHLDQVVGRHQHQHRKGEEREIGEEARLVFVMAHVAKRIEMHESRNSVDDDQHDRGQRVDAEGPVGLKCPEEIHFSTSTFWSWPSCRKPTKFTHDRMAEMNSKAVVRYIGHIGP